MRLRGVTLSIIVVLAIGIILSALFIRHKESARVDIVAINHMVKTIEGNWENIDEGDYSSMEQPFTVMDNRGEILYQTGGGVHTTINEAIMNRDTIVDIMHQGGIAGKLIIHHQETEITEQLKKQLMTVVMGVFAAIAFISAAYIYYIHTRVFKPFKQLQSFAVHVAGGVLDVPLAMDKHNRFGAFTESFDLMREALAEARHREYAANRSKKELVASLSHDIRTPVASIKAVTELMLMRATDDKAIKQLNTIQSKAEQINLLVTDMFHATLEELQQLKVSITEEPSAVLSGMIDNVNYDNQISYERIPPCIILADVMRLQQVLDNILSNAYKYAGTSVTISSRIQDCYLELHIKDYGEGINEEELPLVFNKFYRGNNAEGITGSGLGLYISKYLMQNMQGDIECHNRKDGLTVIVSLKLA